MQVNAYGYFHFVINFYFKEYLIMPYEIIGHKQKRKSLLLTMRPYRRCSAFSMAKLSSFHNFLKSRYYRAGSSIFEQMGSNSAFHPSN